ncbi:hypothetical protein [Leifsonia sp. PS1209]|uniref:hypothetical protein n=1 Tax=Leifsonia sp. PS1209 TaxID=2724914 RepID=UPI001442BDED|nr:hypothetical protein [Leifsonia sp. PS1209]QJA00224.1 hypothetical protein HF024_18090 [Leifsonia sp. PS1209]
MADPDTASAVTQASVQNSVRRGRSMERGPGLYPDPVWFKVDDSGDLQEVGDEYA